MTPQEEKAEKGRQLVAGGLPRASALLLRRCVACHSTVQAEDDPGRLAVADADLYCPGRDCAEVARRNVSQGTLRDLVFARDRGLCAECGEDVLQVETGLAELREQRATVPGGWTRWRTRVHQLGRLGYDRVRLEKGHSLWDADHVDPQVKGGPTCLANARTLCRPCHKRVTGELSDERTNARHLGGKRS